MHQNDFKQLLGELCSVCSFVLHAKNIHLHIQNPCYLLFLILFFLKFLSKFSETLYS